MIMFAKVAEFQRRGVVHYHAIVRVDGPGGPGTSPPTECSTNMLGHVIKAATDAVTVAPAKELRRTAEAVAWGAQREIVGLDQHTCTSAAGYIAKYATKATETATGGSLVKPIRSRRQLNTIQLSDHVRTLISTAWNLGEETGLEAFKRWAHQFGYGGHTLTKSHQYSLTFAALRATRARWNQADGDRAVVVRTKLTYAGRGYIAAARGSQPRRLIPKANRQRVRHE
jgi:hypothetical protein